MKPLLNIFILITLATTILVNNVTVEDALLLLIATGTHIYIMGRYKFLPNLSKYVVLFILWISVVVMPAFHLVYHLLAYVNYNISQIDYNRITSFGSKIYFISTFSFVIMERVVKRKKFANRHYTSLRIPDGIIILLFIILYGLSIFSYAIGLGRMGAEAVELPFHLGGIINLLRKILAPLLFAILVENHIVRGVKFPRKFFVLYAAWCLLEIFAWMSKSILVSHLEPLFIILFLYYRPNLKTIARYLIPIAVVFLFLYPIIGAMRYVNDNGSLSKNFVEAKKTTDDENAGNNTNPLIKPLNRFFMTAHQYSQDYSYIDNNSLFDFSRLLPIILLRGAATYQTQVIDGYPETANHSSGTSGLMDPLLHGGYGLCYLMVFLFFVMAVFIDRSLPTKRYSIYVVLFLILFEFCGFKNISALYDPVGMQVLFLRLLAIYIAYKLNFKQKESYEYNPK